MENVTMTKRTGALEDVLVIDLGRVLACPFSTSILADMGARVIKVEMPGVGDDSRQYGPYVNGESAYFANMNRNKEGITLNMKSDEGKKIFIELIKKADILFENFRPGVMEKLGLGWDTLKEINPQLIYVQISGFGSYGRYSQRPGYDILAQAMGGMMSVTGPRGGAPTRAGSGIGDMIAGLNAAMGALAALHAREIIGHGQHVDVALLDGMVIMLENHLTRYRYSGKIPVRNGNAYPAIAPYDSFHAKDGDFVMACGNQIMFTRFATNVAKHPEWVTDERFSNNVIRTEHADEIKAEIEKWAAQYTTQEVVKMLLDGGVPAGVVFDLSQVTKDPHIVEDRGMFPECRHPVIGTQYVNGDAVKLSDTPAHIYRHAPVLGQDTEAVLAEFLGYDSAKVAELKEQKVI